MYAQYGCQNNQTHSYLYLTLINHFVLFLDSQIPYYASWHLLAPRSQQMIKMAQGVIQKNSWKYFGSCAIFPEQKKCSSSFSESFLDFSSFKEKGKSQSRSNWLVFFLQHPPSFSSYKRMYFISFHHLSADISDSTNS